MKTRLLVLACTAMFSAASQAAVIIDDFNDGNDTGWARNSPLGSFGGAGIFTFPNGNSYRIAAPTTPNTLLGPGRAGSLRNDGSETNFLMQVDLVDWDASQVDMVAGLLARVSQVGTGTTDGYAFLVEPDEGISLVRITNEAPTVLGLSSAAPLVLSIANDYRMIFRGNGTTLTGEIFNLNNLVTPLASVSASDATYGSGIGGLFVFDSSTAANGTAAATFDNFTSVPEPTAAVLGIAGLALLSRRRRA